MALDVGKRRIGVAVSDELGLTAQGLPTIERKNNREDFAALASLASAHNVCLFLVGHPISMSGEEGPQAASVRRFAEALSQRTGVPVKLWDERLTTVQAQRVLRQSGIGIQKRARAADRLSAVILLQSYLDAAGMGLQPGCAP